MSDDTYSERDIIRIRLSQEAIEGFLKRIEDNKDLFGTKSLDDIVMDALQYVDDHFADYVDSGYIKKKRNSFTAKVDQSS